ncbi:MAG: FkbM family methyltransferase [Archangium sp.]|nr:FkbM family methyltransferase [Archangium sp.]
MLEQVYRSILRAGDTAIDVGAHVGRHTVPMAGAVGQAGRVHSFEPLPFAYQALVKRLGEDQALQVTPRNLALGEEEGEAEFTFVPDFPEYSGFKERKYHSDSLRKETIRVQVRRLDSFKEEFGKVRFIKVDAEGGELTILRSGRALIEASQPIVSFELGNAALINYSYEAGDYFDFFAGLGYRVHSIFGLPLTKDQFVAHAERQFFWDYVALPAGEAWFFNHSHLEVLVRQLAAAEEHVQARAAAEAKLSEVLNSRTWRLTAPLRRAKDAIQSAREKGWNR